MPEIKRISYAGKNRTNYAIACMFGRPDIRTEKPTTGLMGPAVPWGWTTCQHCRHQGKVITSEGWATCGVCGGTGYYPVEFFPEDFGGKNITFQLIAKILQMPHSQSKDKAISLIREHLLVFLDSDGSDPQPRISYRIAKAIAYSLDPDPAT